jgi:hypothetical protein
MRLWISLGLAIAVSATTVAHGIIVGPGPGTHHGEFRDDPQSGISFEMRRTDSGHRRIVEVFASGMDFTCEDGDPGQTSLVSLNRGFRVKRDRTFEGRADATILGFDPPARFRGKVRRHGRVVGTLRVHGRIDPGNQPKTNCDTGVQEWKAKRSPPVLKP